MANSALLKSSLAKKYWMAFTGLFLCLFLMGHLAGNLQLLLDPVTAREKFNAYALFMTTNPLVKILSYVTYLSILFHAIDGIMLTIQNNKARPHKYAYSDPSKSSVWSSRYMGVLGTLILVFIVVHMNDFWREMHWELTPTYRLQDGTMVKDLYIEVKEAFENLWYVLLYVGCMIPVGLHLSHGFSSAFQSLGLNHSKYNTAIKLAGTGFSIIVPALFAIIPLYMHFVL
jgi:succinate dehydrogenase / fumarate reductase cytochrome b subunit